LDETGYCHHRRGCRGLELATTLGRRLDKRGKANVILVDRSSTHIWKPLLHEVATGAMDSSVDQISYRAVARYRHFRFVLGEFSGLDRQNQTITLNAILDEDGNTVLPERELSYDYLVLALGSITNDFRDSRREGSLLFPGFAGTGTALPEDVPEHADAG